MDFELVTIHQLDPQQHKLLSSLHYSVMETLLSDLGLPIVARFYQLAADDEKVIGFCALQENNVIGWVVGSPHPQVLNEKLRKPFYWFVIQMLRVLFTRPTLLVQLYISALSAREEEIALGSNEIELTYIGVAPEARGQKTGFVLLQKFVDACRKNGYHKIRLSVETDNVSAISLYQKDGFQITETVLEGSYERHRMKLDL